MAPMEPPDVFPKGLKLLEKQGPPVVKEGLPWQDPEDETEREGLLVCRQCGQHITKESWRVSVDGAHRHTFANPQGNVYDIGCFGSAMGCLGAGPPSTEFSWFRGYSWQIVLCAACMTHLGWFFLSSGEHHFFGLIVDRLVSAY